MVRMPELCLEIWRWLNCALVLLVLLSNSAILHVVHRNRNLHTTAYAFVCNLAVCDMCYGLGVAFFTAMVYYPGLSNSFTACRLALIAFYGSIGFATVGIALISVERCVAIKCAIHYNRMLTKGRVALLIAASPALFVALVAGIVFGSAEESKNRGCVTREVLPSWAIALASACVMATQLASTACYLVVYLVARKQRNRISQEFDYLSRLAALTAPAAARGKNTNRDAWRRRHSWRLTVTVGIVLLVFYVFWVPAWLIQLLRINQKENELTLTLAYFSSSYSTINSVANIFIYGFKTKEFREAAKRTFLAVFFGGSGGAGTAYDSHAGCRQTDNASNINNGISKRRDTGVAMTTVGPVTCSGVYTISQGASVPVARQSSGRTSSNEDLLNAAKV